MADILDLPFDQYQRYELVHALLESVRQPGETFHVLDVGGRTALLREFLGKDRVDLVDIDPSGVSELVLGSGARLPFRDNSVDVVAAFDTLEHVPPELRKAFVAECGRVARRYVMLAGPYDSPRVAEAEEILLDFLKTRLDWEHRYLAEHRENGLPDAAATTRGLEGAGARVSKYGHGALDRWLLLMSLELYVEHEPLLRNLAPRIYRLYNEHLFRSDHGEDVYRHAIVGVFGDSPVPSLERALDPVGSAPPELTKFLTTVGHELLRYDAVRDSFQPELDRVHDVVRSLEKDLGEHKSALSTLQLDLDGSKKVIDTLDQDRAECVKTIKALRDEGERERTAFQSILADTEERFGAASADLDGHRATVAELRRMRSEELEELERRGTRLEELGQELHSIESLRHEAHERLVKALERVESTEQEKQMLGQTQVRLRSDIAAALAGAETPEERRAILDAEDMTLEQELGLLIEMRDRRLEQRNDARKELGTVKGELEEARGELEEIRAELAAVENMNGALQYQLESRWTRLGQALHLVRRDPRPPQS